MVNQPSWSGIAAAAALGLGYDITRDIQLVAEWDRNRLKFVSGRDDVDIYSAGVRFKF